MNDILIATPTYNEAGNIAALLRQPGWDEILADAMRVQSRQTANFAQRLGGGQAGVDTVATRRADQIMRGYEASIPEAERRRIRPAGGGRSRGPLLYDGAHDVD